ncbi:hypothetical protein [Streptomyces luteireticuli]|uniref:hypothetical protein n=1 Tax=Streptomyces luteireticuli TaxID=173858 RepID=UPI0035587E0D
MREAQHLYINGERTAPVDGTVQELTELGGKAPQIVLPDDLPGSLKVAVAERMRTGYVLINDADFDFNTFWAATSSPATAASGPASASASTWRPNPSSVSPPDTPPASTPTHASTERPVTTRCKATSAHE